MSLKELSLNWNDHHRTLVQVFEKLLDKNALVDCTIAAEGQYLKAHRIILSACSPFFELLFCQENEKNPIIILKDIKFKELKALIDFIYRGTVKIPEDSLQNFVEAAESLQIKGLGVDDKRNNSEGRVKDPLHTDRRRGRISPIPRKRIRNTLLSNSEEDSSVVFLGTAKNSESLPQYQVERNTPSSSSSLSALTCSTLTTASTSLFVSNYKNCQSSTERTISSTELLLPCDERAVKTEPLTEVYVPEAGVLTDPKQEIYMDTSLSDGEDRMGESAVDVPNQFRRNQYSSFEPRQESQLVADVSYVVQQTEAHNTTQGGGTSGTVSRWQERVHLGDSTQLTPLGKGIGDNSLNITDEESRECVYIHNTRTPTVTEATSFSDVIPSTESTPPRAKRQYYANTEWPPKNRGYQQEGNSGSDRLNRSAELIPNDLCYSMCGYHCSDVLSKDERKLVFDHFHSLDTHGQRDFLSNLMEPFFCKSVNFAAKRKRVVSYRYSVLIEGQRKTVCKSAVLNLLRINRAKLESVRDQVTNSFLKSKIM